ILRIKSNKNLKEMAEYMGSSSAYLSAVENGRKRITEAVLAGTVEFFSAQGETKEDVRRKLESLVDKSQPDCRIVREGADDGSRALAVAFARKISDLEEEDRRMFMEILGEPKEV